jgi:hypothetical protein
MVHIKSANEIVLQLIDFFKIAIPEASTAPGSVFRDLIDSQASTTALLYEELSKISNLQSLRLVAASDLDRLAQNFGATRKNSSKSSGLALFTFSSIPAVVSINKGDIITSSNGSTFSVANGISVNPAQSNSYKSIAIKYQNDLNFLNITDTFAVEVSVIATSPGVSGNIPKYSLVRTSIPGVSNVTNTFSFTGGSDQEDDATFRNRVLSIFSGSNIGTALGYKNLALSDTSVEDAIVVGPGDPLMTRDGTQVKVNTDGSRTIISEGTGGKVDTIILGSRITQFTDTFIYRDQSNNNDPTDAKNIFTLGQIAADVGKTITRRRIDDIANGALPAQPVEEILEVTGSLSGTNFIPKSTDSLGRVSGNYELIKDTGSYGGSPFGFDKFAWTSNKISLFQEDRIKSKFNGQDNTTFTDVLTIPKVQQSISIANENSTVSSNDRSIIQLLHTPSSAATRVFNVNTGERYIVVNQNLDGTGSVNTTGRVQISGNTLPATSDILQVDYTWIVDYDGFSDYDGKVLHNNPRPVADSIDWGMSNVIRNERVLFTQDATNTFFVGTTKHPITAVVYANEFSSTNGFVSASVVPNFSSRKAIVLSKLDNPIDTVETIRLQNTNEEIYLTQEGDGFIVNTRTVVGIQIKYDITIVLPTDTPAIIEDATTITYNTLDTFNITNSTGNSVANQITIPVVNVSATTSSVYLDITYVAAIQDLTVSGITSLPLSRGGNGFISNSNIGSVNGIKTNTSRRENQTIQINGSSQLYIDLTITSTDYTMIASQVVSVVDLASGKEIWNNTFPGTLTTNTNSNYRLIFSGHNSPNIGENVLVIYFADDNRRVQPFTFTNDIFSKSFQTLQFDFTTNNLYLPIHSFTAETSLSFDIIDPTTGLSLGSASDGYIASTLSSGLIGNFSSTTFNFTNIDDLLGKIVRINNSTNVNNTGSFSINSYNTSTRILALTTSVADISNDQISVIRLADNKDLWNDDGTIDVSTNTINLPTTALASAGDEVAVLLFSSKNLHQSPTRLSINVADQINNTGIITVSGTTITKVADIVFTAINDGLTQNVIEAIKTFLSSTSTTVIPTNDYVVRLMSLEKVDATTNNEVLSTLATYDVFGTRINDNSFYNNEMLSGSNLTNVEFTLPSSTNNITNTPKIGDKLRITFYYATDDDSENLYFTRNGTLYTNKKFALIDRVYISSGFNASQSTRFTISEFNQPATGSRYKAFYDYLAPKQNERILIRYNYNKLISDVSFTIENSRPINADVLVRAARQLLIDATLNIVVKSNTIITPSIVIQNVVDRLTATINTNKLGDVISSSDLIAAAQAVDGVERARILFFNTDGQTGQQLSIAAQSDQYFVANDVIVNQEAR